MIVTTASACCGRTGKPVPEPSAATTCGGHIRTAACRSNGVLGCNHHYCACQATSMRICTHATMQQHSVPARRRRCSTRCGRSTPAERASWTAAPAAPSGPERAPPPPPRPWRAPAAGGAPHPLPTGAPSGRLHQCPCLPQPAVPGDAPLIPRCRQAGNSQGGIWLGALGRSPDNTRALHPGRRGPRSASPHTCSLAYVSLLTPLPRLTPTPARHATDADTYLVKRCNACGTQAGYSVVRGGPWRAQMHPAQRMGWGQLAPPEAPPPRSRCRAQ